MIPKAEADLLERVAHIIGEKTPYHTSDELKIREQEIGEYVERTVKAGMGYK